MIIVNERVEECSVKLGTTFFLFLESQRLREGSWHSPLFQTSRHERKASREQDEDRNPLKCRLTSSRIRINICWMGTLSQHHGDPLPPVSIKQEQEKAALPREWKIPLSAAKQTTQKRLGQT